MNIIKQAVYRIRRSTVLGGMLIALLILVFAQLPAAAYAGPLTLFAFAPAGSSCTLPDGSTDGVVVLNGGAQTPTCCPQHTDGVSCLYAKYINPLVALLAAAVGVVVVIAIVYGAIEFVTSGGDPQRAAAGRKRIVNALIGLAAFLLLYAFLQFLLPGGLANNG